jgi:hypothetical protein
MSVETSLFATMSLYLLSSNIESIGLYGVETRDFHFAIAQKRMLKAATLVQLFKINFIDKICVNG